MNNFADHVVVGRTVRHGTGAGLLAAGKLLQCLVLLVAVALHLMLALIPLLLISDLNAIFRPRVISVCLVLTVFMLAESGLQQSGRQDPRPSSPRPVDHRALGWSLVSSLTLLALVWLGTLTAEQSGFGAGGWLIFLCGGGLALSGIGLRGWAMWSLGCDFRSEIEVTAEQTLKTSGIYRRLRHPSETGLLMIAVGIALLLGSGPAALLAVLGLLPVSLLRIRNEERQLLAAFGNDYREYARRVPGLW